MILRIHVHDTSDVPVGAGPIVTATRWTHTARLDRAGRFAFDMPANDPRATYLANKYKAYAYGTVDGTDTLLGAGIVDRIETVVQGEATLLRVSGDDLLSELANASVGYLELFATEAVTAAKATFTYLDGGEYTSADMTTAYDGNVGTYYTVSNWTTDDYLYVAGETALSGATITFNTGVNNNAATLSGQYWDGSQWSALSDLVDGTSDGTRTMHQNGTISWTRPTNQETVTHAGLEAYWVRFQVSATCTGMEFAETDVIQDTETTTALSTLEGEFPGGWSVDDSGDGYAETGNPVYFGFSGESVLAALIRLGEITGEHFRLGTGRTIEWLQDDTPDSGIYATGGSGGGGTYGCTIQELTQTADSYDLITRIYPYGSGAGSGRTTIAVSDRSVPAGYTKSNVVENGQSYYYLKADSAESTYGIIERHINFPDVGQIDTNDAHARLAANALFDAAYNYLRTHSAINYAYRMRVTGLSQTVQPGETVRVSYHEYHDGTHTVNIDRADLILLEVEDVVDAAGVRTVGWVAATTDTWPGSDASRIAGGLQATQRYLSRGQPASTVTTQTIVSDNVDIDGGTIDGTPVGSNTPASGAFTTLTASSYATIADSLAVGNGLGVTGNISVTGTVDGVDISAHAANDSAHHAPITVGNTGLSLSTQQVSLNLAATSGLAISAGLMLADSIAGSGLTISSKVLAVGQGAGLTVSADAVALTTPGTLTHATSNSAAGNHTHAVTASSNPGAAASLLKTDASGYLQLARIGLGTAPSYPLHVSGATQQARIDYNTSNYLSITVGSDGTTQITTATGASGGSLKLAPVGDVVFDPAGNDLLPETAYDLNIGSMQKKYLTLHCAELWVETLVAQNTIATIGGRILVGPTTKLAADFGSADSRMLVEHNEWALNDTLYMEASGKVEFMRVYGRAITGVWQVSDIFSIAGNLTAYFPPGTYFTVAGSTGNDGEYVVKSVVYSDQTYIHVTTDIPSAVADGFIVYTGEQGTGPFYYMNITRNLDGSGANDWYAGDAVFNTGYVGDGFLDLYSVHGVKSASEYGPTLVGNVRLSMTYNDWAPHWAMGNLNGVYGYATTAYGFAAGKYANGYSFLTADATNGIRMLKRSGGVDTTLAQWAVNGTITIGQVAASQSNVQITAGALKLRNNTDEKIVLAADGSSYFAGVMTLGTDGEIRQGTGTLGSDYTGLRIWRDTGVGRIGGYNSDTLQWYGGTDGKLYAGAGGIIIDAEGIKISPMATHLYWRTGSWDVAEIFGYVTGSTPNRTGRLSIRSEMESGADGLIYLNDAVYIDSPSGEVSIRPGYDFRAYDEAFLTVGLNVGSATGAGVGDVFASGALNVAGRTIVMSDSFNYADNAAVDIMTADVGAGDMLYLEVTIATHRAAATGAYGGLKKYRVWIYRDSGGTERVNETVELTDFANNGTISSDSLTNSRSADTYTFTIQRDHTDTPGTRMTVLVYGTHYGCSNIAML